MSAGLRIPLVEAERLVGQVVALLADACDRIEIAGSIRRRRPDVGDIEIVAIPRLEKIAEGLWGQDYHADRLGERLGVARVAGTLTPRKVEVHRKDGSIEESQRVGDRYQALEYEGIPVDLFIVRPPADWGVVFTIRTGPADWSERLVTDCKRRFDRVEGGHLTHFGNTVPCPEERDFLAAIGQPWVEPEERSAARVALWRGANA